MVTGMGYFSVLLSPVHLNKLISFPLPSLQGTASASEPAPAINKHALDIWEYPLPVIHDSAPFGSCIGCVYKDAAKTYKKVGHVCVRAGGRAGVQWFGQSISIETLWIRSPPKYGFTRLSSPSLSLGSYQQSNVHVRVCVVEK